MAKTIESACPWSRGCQRRGPGRNVFRPLSVSTWGTNMDHCSDAHSTGPQTSRVAACCCGQLRAHVIGEPVRVSICHCLACQRRTGSVFGAQARYPSSAVCIHGARVEYTRLGTEGTTITFRFCPTCGATVYYTLGCRADGIMIPVGAFADPAFPAPELSVYEERMHPWVQVPGMCEHIP